MHFNQLVFIYVHTLSLLLIIEIKCTLLNLLKKTLQAVSMTQQEFKTNFDEQDLQYNIQLILLASHFRKVLILGKSSI